MPVFVFVCGFQTTKHIYVYAYVCVCISLSIYLENQVIALYGHGRLSTYLI